MQKARYRASLGHMGQQRGHIQPGFTVNGAAVVLHRHHACPRLGKQAGCHAPHIAKALHCQAGGGNVQANMPGGFHAHGVDAAARSVAPAQ